MERGGVGHATVGETHEIAYVDLYTTYMRTTQGQDAFGHNVQTIITYSTMVKTFSNKYRWTRLFNARRVHLLQSTPNFCELF
jgi:hypothetical protein